MSAFRKLLYPFSLLYGLAIRLRHFLYDHSILKTQSFDIPLICVGNLSVGGTGKSPMTEYLIRLLKSSHHVAVLSRGYKRKTIGYVLADATSDALQIGDEPYQYFRKFPDITVAVCEDRTTGIKKLKEESPTTELIILDDAFQHRKVTAGFSILLSSYGNLFTDDLLLPAGNLRDLRSRVDAADVILVTKCPSTLSPEKKEQITKGIHRYTKKPIFFTGITYDSELRNNRKRISLNTLQNTPFTLVTGIANPDPLVSFLKKEGFNFEHLKYGDHHNFNLQEIKMLKSRAQIITTEKDFVRLEKHLPDSLYISIEPYFLDETKNEFDQIVCNYLKKEKRIQ
ncbi:tetraacyldisaccharide 4'-kinase [Flavobacteriaceae bacterium M23B6Z8]